MNRPRMLTLWIGFAVLCVLGTALKERQNRREQQRLQAGWAFLDRIRTHWQERDARRGGPAQDDHFTVEELEDRLGVERGTLKPTTRSITGARRELAIYTYVDPVSLFRWEFNFEDGRWMGFSAANHTDVRPVLTVHVEHLRRLVVRAGPLVWTGLLVLILVLAAVGRAGAGLAQGGLAVAIVCFLAWLTAPNYTIAGWRSNDALFWGTAMVIVSAAVLWQRCSVRAGRRREQAMRGLCPVCHYDLRAHAPGQRCPECGWSIPADFPRPNSGAVERATDGRDISAQA